LRNLEAMPATGDFSEPLADRARVGDHVRLPGATCSTSAVSSEIKYSFFATLLIVEDINSPE
ncbi:MAG: hypothetical protein ABSG76_26185, partial [Xanthobacteraceae bacterium]